MVSLVLGTALDGRNKPFALTSPEQVAAHKNLIGVSGSGKSRALASMWLQLASQGQAVSLIDPHGDMSRLLLGTLLQQGVFADQRVFDRLYYVDFGYPDPTRTIPFNVLKQGYPPHTVAANMLEVCKRAWSSVTATPSLDNVILASVLTLVENNLPFTQLNRFLLDSAFRASLVSNVSDPLVGDFFQRFDSKASQLADSTLRRSFLLTFSPVLRNALGAQENRLNQRYILDHGISCIYNLGGLDEYTKRFLGCLLMVNIEQAFLARATMPEDKRIPHHVIVDEFPLFASASGESFAIMLEQVRKYKGILYLACQTLSQISRDLAGSLQNAIALIFRVGFDDAQHLAPQYTRHDPYKVKHQVSRLPWEDEHGHPLYFSEAETVGQMRDVLQSLDSQKAIVRIGKHTTRIKAITVPDPSVPPTEIQRIADAYAARLFVPVAPAAQVNAAPPPALGLLGNAASTPKRAQRRANT